MSKPKTELKICTFISWISSGPEFSDVKVRGCQDLASAFLADRFHVVYVTVLLSISLSKPRIWKRSRFGYKNVESGEISGLKERDFDDCLCFAYCKQSLHIVFIRDAVVTSMFLFPRIHNNRKSVKRKK